MSMLAADVARVEQTLGGKPLAATVAKLYVGAGGRWKYSRLMGYVALCREGKAHVLRLVSATSQPTVIWEQELYRAFQYTKDRRYFHSFATDSFLAALLFYNENEADLFYQEVNNISRQLASSPTPSPHGSATSLSRYPMPPTHSSTPQGDMKSSSSSFSLSSMFSSGGSTKKSKNKKAPIIDKNMISQPKGFKHVSHIGYTGKGFDLQNIPPQWHEVFKEAGITQEQLADEETAKYIMKTIKKATGGDLSAPTVRAVPPPPPPAVGVSTNTSSLPQSPHRSNVVGPSKAQPPLPSIASSVLSGGRRMPPPPPPSRNRGAPPSLPSNRPTTAISQPTPAATTQNFSPPSQPRVTSTSVGGDLPAPPPPPPPPALMAPVSATPPPAKPLGVPDVTTGRSSLLEQIRSVNPIEGLKKREDPPSDGNNPLKPAISAGDMGGPRGLADILADAMKNRRGDIQESDEEENEEDEDWG